MSASLILTLSFIRSRTRKALGAPSRERYTYCGLKSKTGGYFRRMLIPVLFLSTVFLICYFLTVVSRRPFVLTKEIDFYMLRDIEAPPDETDKQSKMRSMLSLLERKIRKIMALIKFLQQWFSARVLSYIDTNWNNVEQRNHSMSTQGCTF